MATFTDPSDPNYTITTFYDADGKLTYKREPKTTTVTTTGNPAASAISNIGLANIVQGGVKAAGKAAGDIYHGITDLGTIHASPTMAELAPSEVLSSTGGVPGTLYASTADPVYAMESNAGPVSVAPEAATTHSMVPGLAGAYGMYNLFGQNPERSGTRSGIAQGALSGAGIGWSAGGPVGAGIGAALGGLAGAFSTKSRTRGEQHQRDALIKAGINVPIDKSAPDGKHWELNTAFAKSRDVNDLTGADIKDASDFYAMIPGYQNLTDAQKAKTAQQALNTGLVSESKGKINLGIKDSPEYQKWVSQMMQASQNPVQVSGGGRGPSASVPSSPQTKKEKVLSMLSLMPTTAPATRYDFNEIAKNPYATY